LYRACTVEIQGEHGGAIPGFAETIAFRCAVMAPHNRLAGATSAQPRQGARAVRLRLVLRDASLFGFDSFPGGKG
jgi:hypothetical protein